MRTMEEKEKNEELSKAIEDLRAAKPQRPETEKFTFYDERGQRLYNLLSEINELIIELHDEVTHNVFTDIDYHQVSGVLPLWLRDAGHSQEGVMSRGIFEKLVGANNSYFVNKLLYYHDCEMLVNALQNRFNTVETMFTQVYDILTPVLKKTDEDYHTVLYIINEDAERVNAYINSIVINLASSCDIMTKIAVELNGMSGLNFVKYPKMLSANTTYGGYKKLSDALKQDGTYFANERPAAVAKVETIRDEIVHNGSLDYHAILYFGDYDGGVDYWALFPAFKADGNFESFVGRKKFYDDPNRTWNNELPVMVYDFLIISKATLQLLLKNYHKEYYTNAEDLEKFKSEILKLTTSFVDVMKKERGKANKV